VSPSGLVFEMRFGTYAGMAITVNGRFAALIARRSPNLKQAFLHKPIKIIEANREM
jgi:hypothetical protein